VSWLPSRVIAPAVDVFQPTRCGPSEARGTVESSPVQLRFELVEDRMRMHRVVSCMLNSWLLMMISRARVRVSADPSQVRLVCAGCCALLPL